MLDNDTLAPSGEQLTELDDHALAAVVGGLGPASRIFGEIVRVLWDCVITGLVDVIDAAQVGFGDAQAS
jgi:hypothetical protein